MIEPSTNPIPEPVQVVPTVSARRVPTKIQVIIVIVLLTILVALQGWTLLRPSPKWEYKILAVADQVFTTEMQRLGDDGWEVVSTRRATTGPDEPNSKPIFAYEIIFKRSKR